MKLAEKIKELCYDKRLTITDLANKIGMSSSLYTTLKNESIKISTLEKIADVLEVSLIDLLDLKPLDHSTEIEIREQAIGELMDENDKLANIIKLINKHEQFVLEMYHYFEESLSPEERQMLSSNKYYEKFTQYLVSCLGMNIWQSEPDQKMYKANELLFQLAKTPNKEIKSNTIERNNPNTLAFIDKDKKTKYKVVRATRGNNKTKEKPI